MGYKIHIGEAIKSQFEKRGCTVSWLARQLHCDRSNVYDIFKRDSIDTRRLYGICVALEHDFYAELSDAYQQENEESGTKK